MALSRTHVDHAQRSPFAAHLEAESNPTNLIDALAVLKERIRKVEGEKAFYKESCELCEKENQSLRRRITDEGKRSTEERSKREIELFNEKEELLKVINNMRVQMVNQERQISDARHETNQMAAEKKELQARLTSAEDRIAGLQRGVQNARAEAADEAKDIRRRAAKAEADADDLRAELNRQASQLEQLAREKTEAENAVGNMVALQTTLLSTGAEKSEEDKPRETRPKRRRARPMSAPKTRPTRPDVAPALPARKRRVKKRAVPLPDADQDARQLIAALEREKSGLATTYEAIVHDAKHHPLTFAQDRAAQTRLQEVLEDMGRKEQQVTQLRRYRRSVHDSPMGRLLSPSKCTRDHTAARRRPLMR